MKRTLLHRIKGKVLCGLLDHDWPIENGGFVVREDSLVFCKRCREEFYGRTVEDLLPLEVGEQSILDEIATERVRQDLKWGGAEHDDQHSTTDFVGFIQDYAGWARRMDQMGSPDKARRRLIQVAALAVAAVESIDRKAGGAA